MFESKSARMEGFFKLGFGECSTDSSVYSPDMESVCGDDRCTFNETPQNCVEDCGFCGDHKCHSPETLASCPQDCTSVAVCIPGHKYASMTILEAC